MSSENTKNGVKKISLSLRSDLYDWVEKSADELGISRSGFIAMCVTKFRESQQLMPSLNGMMESFTTLVNMYVEGDLPHDVAQMKLDELEAQYKSLKK